MSGIAGGVLGQIPDLRARRAASRAPTSMPATSTRPLVGGKISRQRAHDRRLARAVRPEQADRLAGVGVERHVAHRAVRPNSLVRCSTAIIAGVVRGGSAMRRARRPARRSRIRLALADSRNCRERICAALAMHRHRHTRDRIVSAPPAARPHCRSFWQFASGPALYFGGQRAQEEQHASARRAPSAARDRLVAARASRDALREVEAPAAARSRWRRCAAPRACSASCAARRAPPRLAAHSSLTLADLRDAQQLLRFLVARRRQPLPLRCRATASRRTRRGR